MKALVWKGPSNIRVESVAEPSMATSDVLVRVTSASICGSDIAGYTGRMGNRYPGQIMGHEFGGVVIGVGESDADSWLGARVTVNPLVTCGVCSTCLTGSQQRCDSASLIGVHRQGGFAEAVSVPVSNLCALPAEFPEDLVSLVEPVAHGFHGARVAMDGLPGKSMVVLGGGPVGLLAALAASRLGVDQVIVLERNADRRAISRSFGLLAFDSVSELRQVAQRPDVVFDAVGSAATRALAVDLAPRGGRVVLDGLAEPTGEFPFMQAIVHEVELRGAFAYSADDFAAAVAALELDGFGIQPLVESIPFVEGPRAFAAMAAGGLEVWKTVLEVSHP